MKLFIFYDGIEEIIVAANDREDAFTVIEEQFGAEAADELIMSRMSEYPDDFQFPVNIAANLIAHHGRRIVAHQIVTSATIGFPKPQSVK
jgi:hypothetical protein